MSLSTTLIIGGGIAGLTAALALQRAGVAVRVMEQASRFAEVGAGLTLSQPASRGLFSLGLRRRIEDLADIPIRAGGADYLTGERLPGPDRMAEARHAGDIPYFYQMHRADLHGILAQAVRANDPNAIVLGRRLVSLNQSSQSVTATFDDGSQLECSVLIGADGINSTVRQQLFGPEAPRFTGQVAYRFLVPAETVRPLLSLGPSVNYIGPDRLLLRYIIRRGAVVNAVAFVKTDSWSEEGWTTAVDKAELLQHFRDWHSDVRELLSAAPEDGTRKWALFDRDPMPEWTRGRVTLMGDAAHPMLPFLGLGAAMGIEDAVVFARAFAAHPPAEALAVYEASRRERANAVLLASRRQGDAFQSRDRDRGLPDNEGLFTYDPATVALAA